MDPSNGLETPPRPPPGGGLRLLTWNLRHGGGPKKGRLAEIVLSLLAHKPDLVALTEFHSGTGGSIRGLLADAGLVHQSTSATAPDKNSMLVASRHPLMPTRVGERFPAGPDRMLDVLLPTIGAHGLLVSGVHVPDDSRPKDKAACWQFLIALARERARGSTPDSRETPAAASDPAPEPTENRTISTTSGWAILGDFNSGRHYLDEDGKRFGNTRLLGTFSSLGMLDAWRHLHPLSAERSWSQPVAPGKKALFAASRIDACYLSPHLHKSLKNSHFSHAEREAGHSDHSALIVDLVVETGAAAAHPTPVGCANPACAAGTKPPRNQVDHPPAPTAHGGGAGPETLFSAWKTRDS